jgi:hypothetical protein
MVKKFKKVVIWGHKLHTHTHSYIHYAFFKAFENMGYETLWLDSSDDISGINFSESLFLTEGGVDSGIPLIKGSRYILHNCKTEKYIQAECKFIMLQVYTNDTLNRGEEISPGTVIQFAEDVNVLYMPWATNLLPHEIDPNDATNITDVKNCVFVGSDQGHIGSFFNVCRSNGVGVDWRNPWVTPTSFEENQKLVKNCYMAPALQNSWQVSVGLIPCRIFKNISYGHFGYTNSATTNRIFSNELIYDENMESLFHKIIEFKNSDNHIDKLKYLMNEVKEKHTYINIINDLLKYLPE